MSQQHTTNRKLYIRNEVLWYGTVGTLDDTVHISCCVCRSKADSFDRMASIFGMIHNTWQLQKIVWCGYLGRSSVDVSIILWIERLIFDSKLCAFARGGSWRKFLPEYEYIRALESVIICCVHIIPSSTKQIKTGHSYST
eukprot:scaffold6828_cov53-Attheya_sp.AAC.3